MRSSKSWRNPLPKPPTDGPSEMGDSTTVDEPVEPTIPNIDRIPESVNYIQQSGEVRERVSLEQGWSDEERDAFWFMSQGAQIMPYNWFTWLEQPNSDAFFRNSRHMRMLGYIPTKTSKFNPSGLPIGFAMSRATTQKEAFVGLTCAACHTNLINVKGKKLLIDGAPTLANFVLFFERTVEALDQTANDDEKYSRFARRVLGSNYSVTLAEDLKIDLIALKDKLALRQKINSLPDHYSSDFTSWGRLDAFTNIENAGSAQALDMPKNRNPAIAPVSYPFLWGTHQSDVVQWNGSAPNTPRLVGPMVRNIGQVVGVFGGLKIEQGDNGKIEYSSTVDFEGLGELEGLVSKLSAPQWTDPNAGMPALEEELMAKGKVLYQENCASCHEVVPAEKQFKNYTARMVLVSEVGTDPMAAWAADHHRSATGILKGQRAEVLFGERFQDSTQSINIPVNGVAGIVKKHIGRVTKGVIVSEHYKPDKNWQESLDAHLASRDEILEWKAAQHKMKRYKNSEKNVEGLKYKARPLNGIWATSPYLHNGSVPNLWELLMPEDERMPRFWVGTQAFDTQRVGFVTNRGKNEFRVFNQEGNIRPGNSNKGHLYGTQLSEDDRWALIEYMKSL